MSDQPTIKVEGLPETCHYCGHASDSFPLVAHNGRLAAECPQCWTAIGFVRAVRAEPSAPMPDPRDVCDDCSLPTDHAMAWGNAMVCPGCFDRRQERSLS